MAENSYKWRALPTKSLGVGIPFIECLCRWAEKGILERLVEALQQYHLIQIKVEES